MYIFPSSFSKLKKCMLNKKHQFKFAENLAVLTPNRRNQMLLLNLPLSPWLLARTSRQHTHEQKRSNCCIQWSSTHCSFTNTCGCYTNNRWHVAQDERHAATSPQNSKRQHTPPHKNTLKQPLTRSTMLQRAWKGRWATTASCDETSKDTWNCIVPLCCSY